MSLEEQNSEHRFDSVSTDVVIHFEGLYGSEDMHSRSNPFDDLIAGDSQLTVRYLGMDYLKRR